MSRHMHARLTAVSFSICVAFASQLGAEPIVALTVQNGLIMFDSATPGTVSGPLAITGLTAGDALVGIDRRPQVGPNNNRLYGVGVNTATGSGRLYVLDDVTGAATLVSTLAADPADATAPSPFTTVGGTQFGVDFNPTVDRLRVVSNTGQNLRVNVDTGLTQLDVPLAYNSGDPNFGSSPVNVAVAYSNSFGGATTTVLRGVDIGRSPDLLVVHSNPNGGTLQTALSLPFDASLASYDVSGLTGTPYFAIGFAAGGPSQFYAAGPGGVSLIGSIGGGVAVTGIAAQVGTPVPEPSTLLMLGAGLVGLVRMRRRPRA